MQKKGKTNYDADYDRWGHTPNAVKVIKPKKQKTKKTDKKK